MVNGGAVSDVFLELQDLLDVAAAYQKVPVAKSLRIKGKKWQEEFFFMFLFYFFFSCWENILNRVEKSKAYRSIVNF